MVDGFPYWDELARVREQSPLVSVVIPVYNVERFLVQCLESVIHQTYTNLEIICVNDGSTDHSSAILHDYARKDPRIVDITQENAGLSAARNTALKLVKGKYTLFLDSDDWLDRKALEILVEKSELEHLDMLKFSSTLCYENSKIRKVDPYHNYDLILPEYYLTHSFTYKDLLDRPDILWRIPVTVWSCLFRTEYIKTHNITFPDGLCYEDNLFSHIAYLSGGTIACINKQLHFRSKHSNSITSSLTNYFPHFREIIRLNHNFISQLNDPDLVESFLRSHIPGLLLRFFSFSLLIQRRDLHLLLATLESLLSNHDFTKIWPFSRNETRFTLELLLSKENCLLNKCSHELQKQVTPIELRSRISIIREQPYKTRCTYIIFCDNSEYYYKKIDTIIHNNTKEVEIFCLFNREIHRSEERSIAQLNSSQSVHIYCFRYTNNKANLLNQIVEISSGEYINFCNEYSSTTLPTMMKSNASLSDIILSYSYVSDIWENMNDSSFYFFRKGFLLEKNIQFKDTDLNILQMALTRSESLVITHLKGLKQNNKYQVSVPKNPIYWNLHNKILHLLDSDSLASYSERVTIPALKEWFLYSSMSDFKHSLELVDNSIQLIGGLQRSASIQLDENMESLVFLHSYPTWKLRLKILILRIKMIYSRSSRRKELRHIIRYIRYVAHEN
jgi:glycosyltransferase involved in cell wall biosynthesis